MLYPLKFHPILKEKIWGGNKLKKLLNKTAIQKNLGESWEISTVKDNISLVANGEFVGRDLIDLIKEFKGELIGERVYSKFGSQFPLLIKFIDAKEDLSVQLHPNDQLAKKRHNSFGKTEMWYVVQADQDARLIVGFNKETSKEEYEEYLNQGKIEGLLNFENIVEGDSYFINAGKIHAIGAGSLIAEIQQTSDITYRVYDWDRKDANGNTREMHTDLAIEALDFGSKKDFKLFYDRSLNQSNNLISGTYFTTNYLNIKGELIRDYSDLDSFVTLICVRGSAKLKDKDEEIEFSLGNTILIPASYNSITIFSQDAELLEVYI